MQMRPFLDIRNVAEIVAKGQAAVMVLQALTPSGGKLETKEYRFKVIPNGQKDWRIEPLDPAPIVPKPEPKKVGEVPAEWGTLAVSKCAACHIGAEAKGGFDIRDYPVMSAEQKGKVRARIRHEDASKRMPQAPGPEIGGKATFVPGMKLADAELEIWDRY